MNEQKKYEVIKSLVDHNGNKQRAALELGITVRQVNRLCKTYKEKGKAAFIHGNRGRKPATTIAHDTRQMVIDLYRTKYYDANFTHFTELLERIEGITLSESTVRSILDEAYIFSPRITRTKKRRLEKELKAKQVSLENKKEAEKIQANLVTPEDAHSRRPRCTYFGEMEQMDASPHEWFGCTKTTLHIAVDDATGIITGAWFDKQETLAGYYRVFQQILTNYGIPYQFFTDRRSVFTYKQKKSPSIEEDTYTQFAYACKQLGVGIKVSSVPQAKGRVERMFGTLQSRLPVELRLRGINTIDEANEFLNSYIKEFNAVFALPANSIKSVFEMQPSDEIINLTLAILTQRTVDSGHCIQFQTKYYRMIDKQGLQTHYRRGTKVMVIQTYDGSLYCNVNDKDIYLLEEIPKHAEKSKDIDPDYESPKPVKRHIPPMKHPWRSTAFWKFVKYQEHHFMDHLPA